jgi:AAA domain
MPKLASALRSRGIRTITVPETATMIIQGAHPDISDIAREDQYEFCRFQREVFIVHRLLRERARVYASGFGDDQVVILYDRGEMDGMAYHRHHCFEALAAEAGTTMAQIRDSYTAVFHMVTTANGAEDFFIHANNSARWDNAEEARAFDQRVLAAWAEHPRHTVIDNTTDWQGKLNRLTDATLAAIGSDQQLQIDVSITTSDRTPEELELDLAAADNTIPLRGVRAVDRVSA